MRAATNALADVNALAGTPSLLPHPILSIPTLISHMARCAARRRIHQLLLMALYTSNFLLFQFSLWCGAVRWWWQHAPARGCSCAAGCVLGLCPCNDCPSPGPKVLLSGDSAHAARGSWQRAAASRLMLECIHAIYAAVHLQAAACMHAGLRKVLWYAAARMQFTASLMGWCLSWTTEEGAPPPPPPWGFEGGGQMGGRVCGTASMEVHGARGCTIAFTMCVHAAARNIRRGLCACGIVLVPGPLRLADVQVRGAVPWTSTSMVVKEIKLSPSWNHAHVALHRGFIYVHIPSIRGIHVLY